MLEAEEHFVDGEDVIDMMYEKILDNDVPSVAVRNCKSGLFQQVVCIVQAQFQRDHECERRAFAGGITVFLRGNGTLFELVEYRAGKICAGIALRISKPFFIDLFQNRFCKPCFKFKRVAYRIK